MQTLRQLPFALAAVALLTVVLPSLHAQQPGSIVGRAYDAQSREPIEGLNVRLEGTDLSSTTDDRGTFRIPTAPADPDAVLIFEHVAYGTQADTVTIAAGETAMLRVSLAREAIEMNPMVVEVRSEEAQRQRAAGSSMRVISRDEIERLAPRNRGLEGILDEVLPGIRVSNRSAIPGARICVEFRGVSKSLQDVGDCKYPLLIYDQARIDDAAEVESLIHTLEMDDLHRIEMIPPAEAGVQYGTGSLYGVLVIQTRMGAERGVGSPLPELRPPATYNWAIEPEDHPTDQTLGATFLGNAAGLALGLWAGSQCIEYDRLHIDFFNSRCGAWTSTGARFATLALPVLGSTLAARWAGRTALSQGKWKTTAGLAAMVLAPGYIMAGTGLGQDGSAADVAGKIMVSFGVPLAATLADRFFRTIRVREEPRR